MALLTVKLRHEPVTNEYFKQLNKELQGSNFIKNPFKGQARAIDNLGVINITPVYPPFWIFGIPMFLLVYFVWGLHWAMLPGLILTALGFFWSKYFFFIALLLGLRKKHYTGPLKITSYKKALEKLLEVENGTNRTIKDIKGFKKKVR